MAARCLGAVPLNASGRFSRRSNRDGLCKEIGYIREGLNDTGFVEGKNVAFEFLWANGF
jgi:hypothetical protein